MTSFAKFWLVVAVAALMSVSLGRAETAKTKTVVVPVKEQASCPVAMEARHAAGLSAQVMVGTHREAPMRGPAQRIQFRLTNTKLGAVAAVQIRVNGWNGVGRNLPADKADQRETNSSKTMDVKISIGPRKTAETDVWVHGLTAVNSIDLMSVKYADGSGWKAKSPETCSIVPDPTMLISQR